MSNASIYSSSTAAEEADNAAGSQYVDTGSQYVDIPETIRLQGTSFRFPKFAPTFEGDHQFKPIEPFEHRDRGHDADPQLRNLFPEGLEKTTKNITPKFGTEVWDLQLSELSDAAKNDLALFIAKRGVVVFRNQNLRELPIEKSLEFGRYFGPQHVHPTSGAPKGYPEIHLVYRKKGDKGREQFFTQHATSTAWHSDITYERQPAGTTFLAILEGPESGGDTIFADTVEAYNRLSPEFRKRIEGLEAYHSGVGQTEFAERKGGVVRKNPVGHYHPLVRTHPVTKQKALYVNPQFTTHIKGLKIEESTYLLNFLYDHIAKSADIQLRARWEDGTIVAWDNRRAAHSAILDFDTDEARHAYRITPLAEQPFFDPESSAPGEQKQLD